MTVQKTEAVIVDATRTPFGRYGGAFRDVRPDDLAVTALKALVKRSGVDPATIEDVILGCANQAGEDNRNVARLVAILAGLPVSVPGQTINRLCGSGLQAVITAFHTIQANEADVIVAGGVESMTRAPFVMLKPDQAFPRGEVELADTTIGWRFTNPLLAAEHYPYTMGETAENVAERYHISREDQDAFAAESQQKSARAIASGRFDREIVPVTAFHGAQEPVIIDKDEHPRPGVTAEKLASLPAAFRFDGTITAGNASGINDGAATLLITSRETANANGWKPLARIVSSAVAGVDPAFMGMGPVPASQKALARAGLKISDMDIVELNEAFAAQTVACIRELGIDPARVNPNGGAIALGHPLGASGARLAATLAHELAGGNGRFGLAAMCIGVGQGISMVLERAN